jgi:hypothetical protein
VKAGDSEALSSTEQRTLRMMANREIPGAPMRRICTVFATLWIVFASACSVRAPEPSQAGVGAMLMADRVVLISPHFDEPVPGHIGLSCPAAPAHYFGTMVPGSDTDLAELAVRVEPFRGRDTAYRTDRPMRTTGIGPRGAVRLHSVRSEMASRSAASRTVNSSRGSVETCI